jgi:hypothetical protein
VAAGLIEARADVEPQQRQQLIAALLSAFNASDLQQLCRFALDIDIDQISSGDLAQRAASVVDYADRQGMVVDLVAAAVRQNPGNEQLQQLITSTLSAFYIKKNEHR